MYYWSMHSQSSSISVDVKKKQTKCKKYFGSSGGKYYLARPAMNLIFSYLWTNSTGKNKGRSGVNNCILYNRQKNNVLK
jgi:hypothetical protein